MQTKEGTSSLAVFADIFSPRLLS